MFHTLSLAVLAVAVAILALRVHRLGRPVPPPAPLPLPVPSPPPLPAPAPSAPPLAVDALHAADWPAFVASLSQELRTPLNALIGCAELLGESRLQPGQRRQVEQISESGRAMLRLLADVADLARIEAGDLRLDAAPADLRTTLDHCAAIMRPIAGERGLDLTVSVADDLPDTITLDVQRLRQVLLNLIGNAVKFTDAGTVAVEARRTTLADGRPALGLSVTDTGPGIAPECQHTIFQPFARGVEGVRAAGGTGLGLAIARRIMAAMGGDIAVHSAVGHGSRFTLRLPLGEAAPALPAPSEPASLRGRRVLLAEDHEINQELLLAMLDRLGLVTTLVTNGRDAVEAVAEAGRQGLPFDLVLMDVRMPGMDGLEATARLRTADHDAARLPIIALTASCAPDDVAACLAAGMQDHLAKPVRMDDLGQMLRKALAPGHGGPHPSAAKRQDLQRLTAASAAGAGRLEQRYRQRKAQLLRLIRATIDAGPASSEAADWQDITGQLHKLAGVAANFGEERLGEVARQLERDLTAAPEAAARHRLLGRDWPVLAQFA